MRRRRRAVGFADVCAVALFSDQLERRLEEVHEQAHWAIEFCKQRSCLEPLETPITDHSSDHGSVLLFDERLVVLAVRSATREDNVRLLAIRLQRLVYEHGIIIGIDALERKRQLSPTFSQPRAQH